MKLTALLFTLLTGFSFASISMIVSRVAKDRISFFQFFTLSNLLASVMAWIILPNWELVPGVNWWKVLLLTGSVGVVNTSSQAAFVCSFKFGHNGLSAAIRNTASMLSMIFGLLVLHEKISLINAFGAVVVLSSLAVIAIFGKKNSLSSDLKKWIPAVAASFLFSGLNQILLTGTVLLSPTDRESGVIIPCILLSVGTANIIAAQIEKIIRHTEEKFFNFDTRTWRVLFCWSCAALVQYYLLMKALAYMREAEMASLTWPILIGVNVTSFAIFCRLRWKEKYPLTTLIGMFGCVLGIIMMIAGRK